MEEVKKRIQNGYIHIADVPLKWKDIRNALGYRKLPDKGGY
jgi:hypothetical protein